MGVSVTPIVSLTAIEDIVGDSLASQQVQHTAFNRALSRLSGTSTPPVTKVAGSTYALASGAKTIDLTALEGANGVTVDMTGLELRIILIGSKVGNAAMNFIKGATNGYPLFGATSGRGFELPANGVLAPFLVFVPLDGLSAVSSTSKTIDVSGTGTQEFDFYVFFG